MPKIYIAADHAGFALKEKLKPFLLSHGYEVEDCGAFSLDTEDDYPDVVTPCAQNVVAHPGSFGIVIGASGQGEAIAANRVPGARAVVFYGEPTTMQTDTLGNELSMIASTRAHNDANILSLGARFIPEALVYEPVLLFLSTPFAGGRHTARVHKLG